MSKPEHNRTIDYIEFGATDIEATKRFYAAGEALRRGESRARAHRARDLTFPGGRRFHFLDPNSNELAVWSVTPQNRAEVGGS